MNGTDRAVAAVARILRAPPSPDPDITAAHIVAALRGHGWRPTTVASVPPPPSRPLPPETVHALAARAKQALTKEDT